jgi:hypothetical protein
MSNIVRVRINWDHVPLIKCPPGFHLLNVLPEPEYPFGRKGLALASGWDQLRGTPSAAGMLMLDSDVAVDPEEVAIMEEAIHADPLAVHIAPVRLWPASTKLDTWVWGHGLRKFSQDDDPDAPGIFTFCFTYLPERLIIACVTAGLKTWTYPLVDQRVSKVARGLRLKTHTVRGCAPVHLNY